MSFKPIREEYLMCPDCKGSLIYENEKQRYLCENCQKYYPIIDGIHILLPSKIQESKQCENKHWQTLEVNPMTFEKQIKKNNFVDIIRRYPLSQNARVLELGSGLCDASFNIKRHFPFWNVYVSDVSISSLSQGKKTGNMLGYDVDYYVACDAEKLPFKDAFFDFIFSQAVIHHLVSPLAALSEIRRILRRGGIYFGRHEVMTSKLFHPIYHTFVDLKKRERMWGILEKTYDFSEWEGFVKKAGFEKFDVILDRDTKSRKHGIVPKLYYRILNTLPAHFVKKFMSSTICISARKY